MKIANHRAGAKALGLAARAKNRVVVAQFRPLSGATAVFKIRTSTAPGGKKRDVKPHCKIVPPSNSTFNKEGVGRSLLITGNPATVDGGRSVDKSSTNATSCVIVKSVAMNLFGDGTCRAAKWCAHSHSLSNVSSMLDTQNSVPNRFSTSGSRWSSKKRSNAPETSNFSDSSVASDEVSSTTPAL